MIRLLKYFALLVVYWFVFFISGKCIFLCFNQSIYNKYSSGEIIQAIANGLKMDIAMIAYIMIVSLVFSLFLFFKKLHKPLLIFLQISCTVLFAFQIIADAVVYKSWMNHIDVSVFQYFDTSFSFLASISTLRLVLVLLLFTLWAFLFILLYLKKLSPYLKQESIKWHYPILLFLGTSLFIIPARGGIGVASMNTGTVYFSNHIPLNHLAVNSVWYFLYSIDRNPAEKNKYIYMKEAVAQGICDNYFNTSDSVDMFLTSTRPNIIIVLMESFQSETTYSLGKRKDITPRFDSLTKEGILFSNTIATGTRTDKGLVSVLCGYPAQSVNPIIKYTKKVEKLPSISKTLSKYGYKNLFLYGGNKQFTNMNSLLVSSAFDKIIDVTDFDKSLQTFKWGVHDEFVFQKSIHELSTVKKPFFSLIMTLSNHEPFDVPVRNVFSDIPDENEYYRAMYFADSCLGAFIETAKKQAWWKNTLIILIADHASVLPGNKNNYNINRYRIPMLWLGGALKEKNSVIKKYCSQMDIAKTLLYQCHISSKEYRFSRNIFDKKNNGSALFCYNDGFGFLNDSIIQIFDNSLNRYIENRGTFAGIDSLIGKSYWQIINDDFASK